jgi:hypothetical protein
MPKMQENCGGKDGFQSGGKFDKKREMSFLFNPD